MFIKQSGFGNKTNLLTKTNYQKYVLNYNNLLTWNAGKTDDFKNDSLAERMVCQIGVLIITVCQFTREIYLLIPSFDLIKNQMRWMRHKSSKPACLDNLSPNSLT